MATAPNMIDVVRNMASRYPAEFLRCDVNGNTDFVRLLASELNIHHDRRWGLLGQRGNANQIARDVIAFRLGPTDLHLEGFDVVAGASGPNPSVYWNNVTNYSTMGQPGTAIWVLPAGGSRPDDPTPVPPPPPDTSLDPNVALAQLQQEVVRLRGSGMAQPQVDELIAYAMRIGWPGGAARVSASIYDQLIVWVRQRFAPPSPPENPTKTKLVAIRTELDAVIASL